MSLFRYEAIDHENKSVKDSIEADSARSARAQLRLKGLTPISMQEDTKKPAKKSDLFAPELKSNDVVLITRQLASLLQARMALASALGALVEQAEKPLVRERLAAIRADVVGGSPLSKAIESFPKAFPEMYIATVAAGENTGDLGGVLSKLADALEAKQALQQKVTAAFIYPIVVTIVALGVVVALLTYVVPQVVTVFENTNQDLPGLTIGMIALSDFLRSWGWLLVVGLVSAAFIFRKCYQNASFKLKVDSKLLKLPAFGSFVRAVNTARLASTLSILVGSGVPILKSLSAANRTLGNRALQLAMNDVQERVKEGGSLSRAMGKSGLFPPVLAHLVASGESTGQLAEMLERASTSQQAEVERKALWLTSLLEPILILVMGLVVLLIVLGVMMPIIEVNQMVQ